MEAVFIDTHLLVWLYEDRQGEFSPLARSKIETSDLCVSPVAILELDYLHEIGRVIKKGEVVIADLQDRIGLKVASDLLERVVRHASPLHWTRDPFDRLIVAHASLHHAPLISKDRRIRKHYEHCIW